IKLISDYFKNHLTVKIISLNENGTHSIFIHSLIHSLSVTAYPVGSHDGLEPVPAYTGREAGYTLDRSPDYHRADT
ncbi:hypothetical protein P3454_26045, partial [Vibrio parahaemolyticus]|nr:hypothetical protein [Vibrio parahaemolyticus]